MKTIANMNKTPLSYVVMVLRSHLVLTVASLVKPRAHLAGSMPTKAPPIAIFKRMSMPMADNMLQKPPRSSPKP